jgi:primary-amine oxidase
MRAQIVACFLLAVALPARAQSQHPLDPLTESEIEAAAKTVAASGRMAPDSLFSTIILQEPSKEEVRRFVPGAPLRRQAFVVVYDWRADRTSEAIVDLGQRAVASWKDIAGAQPPLIPAERAIVPKLVKADPRWQEAMRKRGITDFDGVAVSASAPGDPPGPGAQRARIYRSMSFYQAGTRNVLARPIENVVAVTDMNQRKVVEVLDTGVVPIAPAPAELDPKSIGPQRTAPKPLVVSQPQGASFAIRGHEIVWQGWHFRLAMTPREGVVLYTVGYEDGNRVRPILHRASISELAIPYGDPSAEWVWHAPFDAGEYGGMGHKAYPLVAGVHAPANAVLLDAVMSTDTGGANTLKNAIAVYERDGGVLWTHWDGKTSDARRARELVVSWYTNFGNYDYGFNWIFKQDASIEFQIEFTGVLLPKGVAETRCGPSTESCRYGTLVAPHVVGPNHQHFVCMRLDFDVDGAANSVAELNVRNLPTGPKNPYGNAFFMEPTVLATELQARRDLGHGADRMWRVFNPSVVGERGYFSGYTLMPGEGVHPLLSPDAPARRRALFADHALWVTRYRPDELDAAGRYPNQAMGGDGLPRFAARDESIVDTDVVLWYTFGITHIPRVEDWPVMPVHRAGFVLVPDAFFPRNPGLDVPPPAH